MLRIGREKVCYELSSRLKPVAFVKPGETVVLETMTPAGAKRAEDVLTSTPPKTAIRWLTRLGRAIRGAERGHSNRRYRHQAGSQGYLLAKRGEGLWRYSPGKQPGSFVSEGSRFSTASPCRSGPDRCDRHSPGASIPTMYVGETGQHGQRPDYHRDLASCRHKSRALLFPAMSTGDGDGSPTATRECAEVRIQVGLIKGQRISLPSGNGRSNDYHRLRGTTARWPAGGAESAALLMPTA